jgi:hypothetical protein
MSRTNRNRRNRPLEVEALESMMLLSGLTTMPTMAPVAMTIPLPIIVGLQGTTRGVYTSSHHNPDTGTSYSVFTAGTFKHYGPGAVTGNLHSVGFMASGHATGTLQVTLPGGTLTLALTGPTQPGFSPLPTQFSFVITKGTGKFHNAVGDPVGKGTVDVTLKPAMHGGAGQITLVFHPGVVAIA